MKGSHPASRGRVRAYLSEGLKQASFSNFVSQQLFAEYFTPHKGESDSFALDIWILIKQNELGGIIFILNTSNHEPNNNRKHWDLERSSDLPTARSYSNSRTL